jgi:hypothetical protein
VSYVLDGEIGLRIGPVQLTATPGCFVVKRFHITHTFWNATSYPARLLEMISPAGFESYFRELADIYAAGSLRKPQLAADLQARYGLTGNMDCIAPLKTSHGLKLLGE